MSIKKGDTVKVLTGSKDKVNKVGKVLTIDRKSGRVKIEGVFPVKRHLKPQKDPKHPEGGIVDDFGSVHISNVMLMSESLKRPVRTGVAKDEAGKKIRVAKGRNLKAEAV